MHNEALLRLMQLVSPSLPVGAYSYSEGLETLVQTGTIAAATHLNDWLTQELNYGAVRIEAAMIARAHRSTLGADLDQLIAWNHWLTAARESEELRSQSLQMGRSLLKLVQDLEPEQPLWQQFRSALPSEGCHFAIVFGMVAATWDISETAAILGYLHSWLSNLVSAGIKLIPLGQTDGQKLLLQLNPALETATQAIVELADEDLASCNWGLALASMNHETLYSRLFRS